MDTSTREDPAEQIWILRVSNGGPGNALRDALWALDSEGVLKDMMELEVRPDRAPPGSMAKSLQQMLSASTSKKK